MLSRGATANLQRVVSKVSDLPSPLTTEPGERVVVRETEDVYAVDATTRSWAVVGSFKRVGGKKPEEIAAHIESRENPHSTGLAQVCAAGSTVAVESEIVLSDKSERLRTLLRLLKQDSAIRVGPDVGPGTATFWVNTGKVGADVLRVVDEQGTDQFVLGADGSIRTSGALFIKKGFAGPVVFSGLVTVNKLSAADPQIRSTDAPGDLLELSSGRVRGSGKSSHIVLSVGTRGSPGELGPQTPVCYVTEKGLGVGRVPAEALDVDGNINLSGSVCSDLNPSKPDLALGKPGSGWSIAATAVLIEPTDRPGVSIAVKRGPKQAVLMVSRDVGGDLVLLDHEGRLGLGTPRPERTLDVRGSGVAVGAPVGKARFSIAEGSDGDIFIGFNRATDGSPEDSTLPGWSTVVGGRRDLFEVKRRAGTGQWKTLLKLDEHGLALSGDLTVGGLIKTSAPFVVSQLKGPSDANGVEFNTQGSSVRYYAKNPAEHSVHAFTGVWKDKSADLVGLSVDVDDQGSGEGSDILHLAVNGKPVFRFRKDGAISAAEVGSATAPLRRLHSAEVLVGATTIKDGSIATDGDLRLTPKSGRLEVGDKVHFKGSKITLHADGDRLSVGSIVLDAGDSTPGLSFSNPKSVLSGVGHVETAPVKLATSRPGVMVRQVWAGRGTFEAHVVDVVDEGASPASLLADYRLNGKSVLSLSKEELRISGSLNVGGLAMERHQEVVELKGLQVQTKFKVPAGVRIEAVVAKVVEPSNEISFYQVGDSASPDRFIGPTTKLDAGAVTKGFNHCDRGQAAQYVEAPLVVSTDVPALSGKLLVTVFYLNPA